MSESGLSLSARARRTVEQPISFLIALALGNPQLINLAAGLVDPRTLPTEAVGKIVGKLMEDPARGRAALQYDTTLGLGALRAAVLGHVERLEGVSAREMNLSTEEVVVTTGSQQALYLIGDCLIDEGDIVITANPCYFVYTAALSSFGARVLTAPMDEEGMDVERVEQLLGRLEAQGELGRVKMVYVTSYYQNPTGLTLSAPRRERLLEIVKRFSKKNRILILEDAAYRELRYEGSELRSMKSMDSANEFTILAQTFSKPFSPGLKTGYTLMPRDLMEAVVHQKGNHDFGSSSLNQHILLEAMKDGSYTRQVELLRTSYRVKRDRMLKALGENLGAESGVTWTRPAGGLYVWVTLPANMDSSRGSELFEAALKRGVLYVPGDYCFQADENGVVAKNHLRLSFGQVGLEQIAPGIERLAAAIRAVHNTPTEPGRTEPGRVGPATSTLKKITPGACR